MGVFLEQSEDLSTIRLAGAVGIDSAGELKELLLQALASRRELRIVLEEPGDLDVTAMQLLWAARRTAAASGMEFWLEGHAQARVAAALAEAGLEALGPGVDAS